MVQVRAASAAERLWGGEGAELHLGGMGAAPLLPEPARTCWTPSVSLSTRGLRGAVWR
jgi:hypothetical protein